MKPNIYAYSSALTYFIDFYKHLRVTSEASLREWSETMGFDSPTFAMDLLKKRRPLKLKFADLLSQGMGLNGKEALYFKTLIQLEKTTNEEKAYLEEILQSLKPQDLKFAEDEGIYSHWLNVIIYTLSQMDDFAMTASEIKDSLKQSVPLTSIDKSLQILVKNGFIQLDAKNRYRPLKSDFITTPNDTPMKTIHSYYKQIIAKSESAVDMAVEDREFQCFAIGMKKENLVKVKDIMRNARKEICQYWDEQGEHVYQFNLNGFPMAEIRKDN